jgi:hypothetical protein
MKKLLFLLALTFSVLVTRAQNKSDKEPYLVKSLTNESIKNVEVETSGGSISVTGGNASEARIEVYVQQNNYKGKDLSKEDIRKRLDEDYNLNISVANNKLTAIAKPKDRHMDWKNALNISFKIFTSQNVSTDLSTSGGSIDLKNISGKQDFSTSGGSLNIDNLSGNIKGRTSGGSIDLINSKDEIDLATSGGSIKADHCTGNLKLATSGGSLKLSELNGKIEAMTSGGNVKGNTIGGELNAQTSGGNIDLSDLTCSLETSTSGGNIDVAIKEFGKYVKISNSGGNIDLEIPKNKGLNLKLSGDKIKTESLNNFSGTTDEDEINGTLNGGGIPVTVKAGSGKITLTFK